MISILNYGLGNIGSLLNMAKYLGFNAEVISNAEELKNSSKIILPGVGSYDEAVKSIDSIPGLREVLNSKVLKDQVPILGICLGMQLLTRGSEEGALSGFGWIEADTVLLPPFPSIKVPHMGWNSVNTTKSNSLTRDLPLDQRYYFAHSYYVKCDDMKNVHFLSKYGIEFASGISSDNIYGVQFHPEKSHRFGMKLLSNFAQL